MKVVFMIGPPGAGKSTLATTEFKDYVRVNQDELGSREACLKLFNEALAEGKNVVLDRCNHTVKQRQEWLYVACMYRATCQAIVLHAETKLCVDRAMARTNHPTIKNYSVDKVTKIVRSFNNEMQPPTFHESFDSILHIRVR